MKTFKSYLSVAIMLVAGILNTNAQCNFTSSFGSGTASNTSGTSITLSSCNWGGEYATISSVVSGYQYKVTSSIVTDFVTVRRGAPSGPVVYFGIQGGTWTAPVSGTYYAHFSTNSTCGTNTSCRTTNIITVVGAPSINPCSSIVNASCGTSLAYSIPAGTGAWNGLGGPYSTPGNEKVYAFTPTISGSHTINVSTTGTWMDLHYKTSTCGNTGWTYVDDIIGTSFTSNVLSLNAGTTYYFLLDNEGTTANGGNFQVVCPTPAPNPCSNITTIAACGSTNAINLSSGNGLWTGLGGPFSTPGREQIFAFTPAVTGSYPITVLHNSGYYFDLYFKNASSGCNTNNWNYVDDIYTGSSTTNNVNLTAGITYYIMLDNENTTGGTGSIQIGCPCIAPPSGIDFSFTAPFNHSSSTLGGCDDCSFRTGEDRTYKVVINCPGNYVFTTCGGASWDTYLYLSTAPCNGSIIASNDDFCGTQSQISVFLNTGTYFLTVEGFSSASSGAYNVSVTGGGTSVSGTPVLSGSNNLCEGSTAAYSVNGVTGATGYNWSVSGGAVISGQGSSSIVVQWGTTNGVVSVIPTSSCGNGTSSSLSVNITTKPVITVASSNITCNGYNNGQIIISPSNATFEYSIDGTNYFTSNTFSNLSPGTYNASAKIVSLTGCTSNSQIVNLTQPAALVASTSISNYNGYGVSCNGGNNGSANVSVSGGVTAYSYNWSNGATTANNSGLVAGNYNVTVTDANGCTVSSSAAITEPSALVASTSISNYNGYGVSCNGGNNGSANVAVSGGVTAYSYNWSNGATTANNSGLVAGNYNVTVTDANGCTVSSSAAITEPAALVASTSISNYNGYGVSCNGGNNGSANVSVSGGVTAYSYNWSNGATTANNSGLVAGNYNVIVTDANGCTVNSSATITQPTALSLAMSSNQVVYFGYAPTACATLTSSVAGGVTAYSYNWTSSSTSSSAVVCPSLTTTYTLTVTDANGCIISGDVKVCVVNVVCYAGNSNVKKVQICHLPPGNNQNPQTLCVDASSVPSHLAHGDYLGACGTVANCSSSSSRAILPQLGEAAIMQEGINYLVFPNPANDNLNIEFTFVNAGTGKIEITDVTGRLLLSTPVMNGLEGETISNTINLNEYKPGIYFVKLELNNQMYTQKVIKQ